MVDGGYLNWAAASDKFGYCSLAVVRNSIGAAFYVSKYITKDLLRLNSSLGAHLYMCSLGLKRAVSLGYVYGQHIDLDKYLSPLVLFAVLAGLSLKMILLFGLGLVIFCLILFWIYRLMERILLLMKVS